MKSFDASCPPHSNAVSCHSQASLMFFPGTPALRSLTKPKCSSSARALLPRRQPPACSASLASRCANGTAPLFEQSKLRRLRMTQIDAGCVGGAQLLKRWTFQLPELERYVELATTPLDRLCLTP